MNSKKAYNYFKSKFGIVKSNNGWYRFSFPFDHHADQSAAVNFSMGFVKDHRSGYTARIAQFVMDVEEVNYRNALKIVDEYIETEEVFVDRRKFNNVTQVNLPEGYRTLMDITGAIGKKAVSYLESRGFDIDSLDRMGFGYVSDDDCDFYGRIIIPYKVNGVLKYYTGRDFLDRDFLPKYRNPKTQDVGIGKSEIMFNEDALSLYKTVFITEGWADAVTIGDDACAIGGWVFSSSQKSKVIRSRCKEVVLVPDRGFIEGTNTTFYQKALQVGLQFVDFKTVKVINVEEIYSYGKDVNEFGKEALIEQYKKTSKLSYKLAVKHL